MRGLLSRVGEPHRVATPGVAKYLIGEVAERSKALDWNSSNISTGVRGFESHPLRQALQKISSPRDRRSWQRRSGDNARRAAPWRTPGNFAYGARQAAIDQQEAKFPGDPAQGRGAQRRVIPPSPPEFKKGSSAIPPLRHRLLPVSAARRGQIPAPGPVSGRADGM